MKTTLVTVTIASLMAMAMAQIEPSISICSDAGLVGCIYLPTTVDECVDFPAAYNDVVSSVDTDYVYCTFYTDGGCGGSAWYVSTPGPYDTIPAVYNDQFSSVECSFSPE